MATPKLKTAGAPAAPTRLLRPSGTAPAKQIKLKGATGKTIEPKTAAAAPAPKKITPKAEASPAPAPEETDIVSTPAPTPEITTPTPEQIPSTEAEAPATEAAPLETSEPVVTDDEAARLAQEEYERQLEEYNRQMEEYNRQMAALQAAEAAAEPQADAAIEEAPPATEEETEEVPATEPAPKKKKKKAKPQLTEEERAAIQAALEEEQKQPIWKTIPFMAGCGLLVVTIGVCTVLVVQKQAEDARIQAHIDYTNSLLKRAQDINMKGVENLADAAKKQVDVTCSMEDAKALMEVVVDPYVKGENGKPRYGARAEGVAQNACLLLGLAAEKDDAIRDMIFDTMGKECVKIKPTLFHWLLQRIAISDANGVNAGLKKLSKVVAEKKTAKPWAKKTQALAQIWECIGLRVTEADVKEIIALLKTDIADATLAPNLCNCLDNILMMMDNPAAKAEIGDEIFSTMPEKLRSNNTMAATLGRACSTKALDFYKKELETAKGWSGAGPVLLGTWGNDDILEYVVGQKEPFADEPKILACINDVIGTIMKQDRPRSQEEADKLLRMCYADPFVDTSGLKQIIFKTDPESIEYVGDDSPELPALKEQQKELEAKRKQKLQIIRVLGNMSDHDWVINTLKKYIADVDDEVKYEAERALEKTHTNTLNAAQMREAYKNRSKD